jgi:hypothetical protein
LQKVGQRLQAVFSDTCFRFIRGNERNYVVGEDFGVGFRAIYRVSFVPLKPRADSLSVHFVELGQKPGLEVAFVLLAKHHPANV